MKIGIIGDGAIGRYARDRLLADGHELAALVVRPARVAERSAAHPGTACVSSAAELPDNVEHMIDCAGHGALAEHAPAILRRGIGLTTVSIGALADQDLYDRLDAAARDGGAKLYLASGAIGALDCLRAARIGGLDSVTYTGRKPPRGWKGSPAEEKLDLDTMTGKARTHFEGTAREAALQYPKNANVAAAVALAGAGFENTRVRLVADPAVDENVHEIHASGEFGRFSFEVRGNALPDNPKSSALAAMSVVARVAEEMRDIRF